MALGSLAAGSPAGAPRAASVRLQVMRWLLAPLVIAMGVAACGPDATGESVPDTTLAPGELRVAVLVTGLDHPTQIAPDGRGGWVVAELNGTEGGGTGRVLRYPELPGEPTVVVDGLLAPTGVAVDGDAVWVMERRTLSRVGLDPPHARTVVLDELPFNGRSEGSLTAVEGGGVLYDTSGRREGNGLAPGSGSLWFIAAPDAEPALVATGFKHAYAHAATGDGRWYVTEIADGRLDGEVPPDELVVVGEGADAGYPRCVGDRTPIAEVGATAADCADTVRPLALFEPGATPTSVATAPWDPDRLLVALWNRSAIVAVDRSDDGVPHRPEIVLEGLGRPQHLLADGERLLVTDFDGGRILEVTSG